MSDKCRHGFNKEYCATCRCAEATNKKQYGDYEQVNGAVVNELLNENERMREAMQTFVDRVDGGSIRSTKTYKQFKDILSE